MGSILHSLEVPIGEFSAPGDMLNVGLLDRLLGVAGMITLW
jgi:hypothetical protein